MIKSTNAFDFDTDFISILKDPSKIQLESMQQNVSDFQDDIVNLQSLLSKDISSVGIFDFSSHLVYDNLKLFTSPNEETKVSSGAELDTTSPASRCVGSDSTDTNDINNQNEEYLNFLRSRSATFISALKKADFEDGMMNEVAYEVEAYLNKNRYATYLWLHNLYSLNQTDYEVISGLLRVIGLIVNVDESNLLLPIVKCGLADAHLETQEAALMVIERWRTKECLDALRTTHFSSHQIAKYAELVSKELKEELKNVA